MRTIIYGRVSTEDQLEKYGLAAQIRACREYAASRDLNVIAVISDDGISGMTMDRPGLTRVRSMATAGEVDVVLMLDADRLSRELAHLLILKPEIEKRARLEFVTGNFENSPTGQMFFALKGAIAQYERATMLQRTMRGKRERARAGLIVGGRTAYGYSYQDGRLVVDEPRAAIAREIFRRYDTGESMRAIALWLRASGAPTWSGKQWGHSSVRRILTNENLCGRDVLWDASQRGKTTAVASAV
jgi:site-specific DNA recombinase